ncbi:MAG: YbjQ family protein [Coriobacteriales bacterium]|jgi:uncharacterized protein YbjQ (UPF0145 family)
MSTDNRRPIVIITTTNGVDGYRISGYYGIVFGEVIVGINIAKDIGASFRNIVGGRSQGYEEEMAKARNSALSEMEKRAEAMGVNAIVGVDFDYESLGGGGMLMVSVSGTAVTLQPVG